MGIRMIRIDAQGLLKALQGLARLTLFIKNNAQVVMRIGMVGIKEQRLPITLGRLGKASLSGQG